MAQQLGGTNPLVTVDGSGGHRPEVIVASGAVVASGAAADGAAASGNPVAVAGVDGSGNVQTVLTDTGGRVAALMHDGSSNAIASNQGNGDSLGGGARGLWVLPFNQQFNGATWDRVRNNQEATALASAARTGTTSSADITNHNARGILIHLNVTVASGTGGLQVQVMAKDPVSGAYVALNTAPTAITATGTTLYAIIPGASAAGAIAQATPLPVPRTFRITVTHGDGSSYTYSVGYSLIN